MPMMTPIDHSIVMNDKAKYHVKGYTTGGGRVVPSTDHVAEGGGGEGGDAHGHADRTLDVVTRHDHDHCHPRQAPTGHATGTMRMMRMERRRMMKGDVFLKIMVMMSRHDVTSYDVLMMLQMVMMMILTTDRCP
jgi:hypothetical protein